jgi:hypothetical protein
MQPKSLKSLVGVCLLFIQLITLSAVQAKSGGAIAGGGGDATELRVNEIRADIIKWINDGGAKGLMLPSQLSYAEYSSLMNDILQPQKVIIGFIEKDDEANEELSVTVNGSPKTCKGFISLLDAKPHILCNITRFKNTSEADQYKLIHHEYAGLVGIENNEGAASDYEISSQITNFLTKQMVLKLAIKPNADKDLDINDIKCVQKYGNVTCTRYQLAEVTSSTCTSTVTFEMKNGEKINKKFSGFGELKSPITSIFQIILMPVDYVILEVNQSKALKIAKDDLQKNLPLVSEEYETYQLNKCENFFDHSNEIRVREVSHSYDP